MRHALWTRLSSGDGERTKPSIGPDQRWKTAAAVVDWPYLYLYGGRSRHAVLRELWRFHLQTQRWKLLPLRDPPRLDGHTMVACEGMLYVYGGAYSRSTLAPMRVWWPGLDRLEVAAETTTTSGEVGQNPGPLRGHSLVRHGEHLYLYGGYLDLQGSVDKLWRFDCDTNSWSQPDCVVTSGARPPARHDHSCIAFNGCLWIYGGLSNLSPLADLWRYSIVNSSWRRIGSGGRVSESWPGFLHGHSACISSVKMFIYGGANETGLYSNQLWCFDFATNHWCKVNCGSEYPPPSLQFASLVSLDPEASKGQSRVELLAKVRPVPPPRYEQKPEMWQVVDLESSTGLVDDDSHSIKTHHNFLTNGLQPTPNARERLRSVPEYSAHHKTEGSNDSGFAEEQGQLTMAQSTSEAALLIDRHVSVNSDLFVNPAFDRGSTDLEEALPGHVQDDTAMLLAVENRRVSSALRALGGGSRPSTIGSAASSVVTSTQLIEMDSFGVRLGNTANESKPRLHFVPKRRAGSQLNKCRHAGVDWRFVPKTRRLSFVERSSDNTSVDPPPACPSGCLPDYPRSPPLTDSVQEPLGSAGSDRQQRHPLPPPPPMSRNQNQWISTQMSVDGAGGEVGGEWQLKEATSDDSVVQTPLCRHGDGFCSQILLIGGKSDRSAVGVNFLREPLSVWVGCLR